MANKVTIVAAGSDTHLIILKADGKYYTRTPFTDDQPMPGESDPEMMRAALLTKWGNYRVLDTDGTDLPTADSNDVVIVEQTTLGDGEEVFKIVQRAKPDWGNPMPWQKKT